jgi:hypothetical protein
MDDITAATEANEAWLEAQLGNELVREDLAERRAKMAKNAFSFLRAAYWRWAEVLPRHWAPRRPGSAVLAVGDIHLENFGTWRDAEGRLVWGVNDFDEAAAMPWPLDLLRLATSAHLAHRAAADGDDAAPVVARALMKGYAQGLRRPQPIVLDRGFAWLRMVVMAERSEATWTDQEQARSEFWARMTPPASGPGDPPPPRILAALQAAMPAGAKVNGLWPRSAGAGSLGRPRWVMRATWQGGPILREAKAMLPSAWARLKPGLPQASRAAEAARGAHRAPDPCLLFQDGVAVRRLSPNNSKFEAKRHPEILLAPRMLAAMGRDIAAVHAASAGAREAILHELAKAAPLDADGATLAAAACRLAAAIRADQASVPSAWDDGKARKERKKGR